MTYSFDLERAEKIISALEGLTYSSAIRLLASITFLVDEHSKQEYSVSINDGMTKLLLDYNERNKSDLAAETNLV